MSNFTLEQLLQMTPLDAALIAYNEEHGTHLNPRYVVIDQIVDSDGPNLVVRLKARADLTNPSEQRFTGSCLITIVRLDMGVIFRDPFQIPYIDAIASPDVGNTINRKVGIVFDENDFIQDVITPENNVVRAHPNSLRWYGEMIVEQA